MHLDRLRALFREFPQLSAECEGLMAFLKSRAEAGAELFSPEQLAGRIEVDSELATTLLMFADDAGLVRPRYVAYCPEHDMPLRVASSLSELPSEIDCPFHGEMHPLAELRIELQFELSQTEELLQLEEANCR